MHPFAHIFFGESAVTGFLLKTQPVIPAKKRRYFFRMLRQVFKKLVCFFPADIFIKITFQKCPVMILFVAHNVSTQFVVREIFHARPVNNKRQTINHKFPVVRLQKEERGWMSV